MADPANVFAVDDIRSMTGLEVKSVVSTKADVLAAIDRYHRGDDEMGELSSAIDVGADDDDDLSRVTEIVEDAPIVKFVNLLITQAIQDRASDIHIEPARRTCGSASASTACCTR
jgi:type IV pilus assembly protein PilB